MPFFAPSVTAVAEGNVSSMETTDLNTDKPSNDEAPAVDFAAP